MRILRLAAFCPPPHAMPFVVIFREKRGLEPLCGFFSIHYRFFTAASRRSIFLLSAARGRFFLSYFEYTLHSNVHIHADLRLVTFVSGHISAKWTPLACLTLLAGAHTLERGPKFMPHLRKGNTRIWGFASDKFISNLFRKPALPHARRMYTELVTCCFSRVQLFLSDKI
jgi:hypothetical protein